MQKVQVDEMSTYHAAQAVSAQALDLQGAFSALTAIRLNDALVKAGYEPALDSETMAELATLAHVDL